MTWKRTLLLTATCAVASFISAGTAQAQTAVPPMYLLQYPAHISINAAPSTELELVPAGAPAGVPAVVRCTEYCDFWALPGKYTLYARDHSTGERKQLSLRIKESSRYVFEAGDQAASTGGLALGIAGSAAFLTGFFMLMPTLLSSMCEDSDCTSKAEQNAAEAGLVVMLAGAVASPVGFVIYGSNRARLARLGRELDASVGPRSEVRVGVVGVGLGGFGLGGVGTF